MKTRMIALVGRALLVAVLVGAAVGGMPAADGLAAQQVQVYPARTGEPAWLGVSYDVRWVQRDSRCEPQVLVERVVQGSPAERAGLRSGDAITMLDGQPAPAARLAAIAGRLSPGDSVRLRVDRDGRAHDVLAVAEPRPARPPTVIIRRVPGEPGPASAPIVHLDGETLVARNVGSPASGPAGYWFATGDGRTEYRGLGSWSQNDVDARVVRLLRCAREVEWQPAPRARVDLRQLQRRADSLRIAIARRTLEHEDVDHPALRAYTLASGGRGVAGAEVTALVPELAEYFRNARRGLLVLRIAPDSPAERSGLMPGDVIVQGDGRPLESVTELRALLSLPDTRPLRLRLVRKGRALTLTFPRS